VIKAERQLTPRRADLTSFEDTAAQNTKIGYCYQYRQERIRSAAHSIVIFKDFLRPAILGDQLEKSLCPLL